MTLKKEIIAHGFTQKSFAKAVGVHRATVQRWEKKNCFPKKYKEKMQLLLGDSISKYEKNANEFQWRGMNIPVSSVNLFIGGDELDHVKINAIFPLLRMNRRVDSATMEDLRKHLQEVEKTKKPFGVHTIIKEPFKEELNCILYSIKKAKENGSTLSLTIVDLNHRKVVCSGHKIPSKKKIYQALDWK